MCASPPRRVREFTASHILARVMKPLFQTTPLDGRGSEKPQGKQDMSRMQEVGTKSGQKEGQERTFSLTSQGHVTLPMDQEMNKGGRLTHNASYGAPRSIQVEFVVGESSKKKESSGEKIESLLE
jgi:hypothetical protein